MVTSNSNRKYKVSKYFFDLIFLALDFPSSKLFCHCTPPYEDCILSRKLFNWTYFFNSSFDWEAYRVYMQYVCSMYAGIYKYRKTKLTYITALDMYFHFFILNEPWTLEPSKVNIRCALPKHESVSLYSQSISTCYGSLHQARWDNCRKLCRVCGSLCCRHNTWEDDGEDDQDAGGVSDGREVLMMSMDVMFQIEGCQWVQLGWLVWTQHTKCF